MDLDGRTIVEEDGLEILLTRPLSVHFVPDADVESHR